MADEKPTTLSGPKRVAIQAAVGAALGFTTWSLAGPGMVSLYYEPLSQGALSCGADVKQALSKFVMMQLTSAAIGAVVIALAMFFIRRSLAKRRAARGAATAS
jgi:hypothetical protein